MPTLTFGARCVHCRRSLSFSFSLQKWLTTSPVSRNVLFRAMEYLRPFAIPRPKLPEPLPWSDDRRPSTSSFHGDQSSTEYDSSQNGQSSVRKQLPTACPSVSGESGYTEDDCSEASPIETDSVDDCHAASSSSSSASSIAGPSDRQQLMDLAFDDSAGITGHIARDDRLDAFGRYVAQTLHKIHEDYPANAEKLECLIDYSIRQMEAMVLSMRHFSAIGNRRTTTGVDARDIDQGIDSDEPFSPCSTI